MKRELISLEYQGEKPDEDGEGVLFTWIARLSDVRYPLFICRFTRAPRVEWPDGWLAQLTKGVAKEVMGYAAEEDKKQRSRLGVRWPPKRA